MKKTFIFLHATNDLVLIVAVLITNLDYKYIQRKLFVSFLQLDSQHVNQKVKVYNRIQIIFSQFLSMFVYFFTAHQCMQTVA